MRPEQHYHDTITWWRRTGVGQMLDAVFAPPVLVKGHWQDQWELFIAADKTEKVSKAVVHVDRDMATGDFIYLGSSSAADPFSVDGAERIEGWRSSHKPGVPGLAVKRAYLA